MIDREHRLSITRQAEALGLSRGSVYYLPRPTSDADLKLMRCIDELHLDYPFAGARMLRDLLAAEGVKVGRRHAGLTRSDVHLSDPVQLFKQTGPALCRVTNLSTTRLRYMRLLRVRCIRSYSGLGSSQCEPAVSRFSHSSSCPLLRRHSSNIHLSHKLLTTPPLANARPSASTSGK
jgi:hypothetical protein